MREIENKNRMSVDRLKGTPCIYTQAFNMLFSMIHRRKITSISTVSLPEQEMNPVAKLIGEPRWEVVNAADGTTESQQQRVANTNASDPVAGIYGEKAVDGMVFSHELDEDLIGEELESEEELEDFQGVEGMEVDTSVENTETQTEVETHVVEDPVTKGEQSKILPDKKQGVKKKVIRSTAGVGVGPMRRLVHKAKTPRKKPSVKAAQRPEKKPETLAHDKDPPEGSTAGNFVV